jgi:hypothetical protein
MNIEAKRNQQFPSLRVFGCGSSIDSGLLDKDERWDIAKQLVDAAGELIWHDDEYSEFRDRLTDIFNEMSSRKPTTPAQ